MPLSSPVQRKELHHRSIELRGYVRSDGLYDIEAHFTDVKTNEMTLDDRRKLLPGEPLHDMSIRLVVDKDLKVCEVEAAIEGAPYGICRGATEGMRVIKGLTIGPGWSSALRERLSGKAGCTHLRELLGPLATVAFQTLSELRKSRPTATDATGRPKKIDSCYAYASDRQVVLQRWPRFYDGPRYP
jgi:hypothetical protein